jgi:hypothetical protein
VSIASTGLFTRVENSGNDRHITFRPDPPNNEPTVLPAVELVVRQEVTRRFEGTPGSMALAGFVGTEFIQTAVAGQSAGQD